MHDQLIHFIVTKKSNIWSAGIIKTICISKKTVSLVKAIDKKWNMLHLLITRCSHTALLTKLLLYMAWRRRNIDIWWSHHHSKSTE